MAKNDRIQGFYLGDLRWYGPLSIICHKDSIKDFLYWAFDEYRFRLVKVIFSIQNAHPFSSRDAEMHRRSQNTIYSAKFSEKNCKAPSEFKKRGAEEPFLDTSGGTRVVHSGLQMGRHCR